MPQDQGVASTDGFAQTTATRHYPTAQGRSLVEEDRVDQHRGVAGVADTGLGLPRPQRAKALADQIISSQRKEIDEMKALIQELEGKGPRQTAGAS